MFFKTKEEFLLATYAAAVECSNVESVDVSFLTVQQVFARAKEMIVEHDKVMKELSDKCLPGEK